MQKRVLSGVALLGLFGIGACASDEPATTERQDTTVSEAPVVTPEQVAWDSASVADLTCENLEQDILDAAPTRAALAEAYGEADSIRVATEPNRHMAGATDSLFVVYYPGMVVDLRKPENGDDLVDHVEISDNRYLRYPAIGIGAPIDRVARVLGTPKLRDARRVVYDCGLGAEQPVTFMLDQGIVRRIIVDYYLD